MDRAVFIEQLQLLYGKALAGIAAHIVVALIVTVTLWNYAPQRFLVMWLAANVLVAVARIVLVRTYRKSSPSKRGLKRWGVLYAVAMACTGAIWGSLGVVVVAIHLDPSYQAFVTLVLGGLAVGAMAMSSSFPPAYLAFLIPLFLPVAVGFFLQASSMGTSIAGLIGVSAVLLYQFSLFVNERILVAMRLSLEKEDLINQLMEVQENERKRIASELHDGIGQSLSVLKYSLENSLKTFSENPGQTDIHEILEAGGQKIQETIAELRQIAMDLRPPMLEDLGILATLDWFCREYQNVHPAVNLTTWYGIREDDIPQKLRAVIYRISQEAFNNITKHANADQVSLKLEKTASGIRLDIKDNGQGFDSHTHMDGQVGFGLMSMRERAESTKGVFNIQSSSGKGTLVEVCWPHTEDVE